MEEGAITGRLHRVLLLTRIPPNPLYFVTKSWLILCHAMDCSLPDSSVLGTLQARMLVWVAIGLNPDLLHCSRLFIV